ncbi:MAG: hypothetical protein U0136_06715 [Bdellovibrionota bacterium]
MQLPKPTLSALWILRTVAALNLLTLLAVVSFYLRAAVAVGHLPFYDHPDPKDLHFNIHFALVWPLLRFQPSILITFAAAAVWESLRPPSKGFNHAVAANVLLYAAFACFMSQTEFLDWYLD